MHCPLKIVGICTVALVAGAVAIAQPSGDKPKPAAQPPKTTTPAKPADGKGAPPAGMPDMSPEEMAIMQKCMEASVPGKMHERLASTCGTWDGKCKMWMKPGGEPTESACTTTITSILDGRFTRGETHGSFDFGGQAMKFDGIGTYGYNNTTKQFESNWIDSMGTMQMNCTGSLSADGKVLTWNTKFMDPGTEKETWMRLVETMKGADSMTLEFFSPDIKTGKEFRMMEISYTRKAGTTPMKKTDSHATPK